MVLDRVAAVAVVHLRARSWLGIGLYLDFGRRVVGDRFVGGAWVGGLVWGREDDLKESRLE